MIYLYKELNKKYNVNYLKIISKKYHNAIFTMDSAFNIGNRKIIYSLIFPRFYEERDNIKFAKDIYFTTMPFEKIMYMQINLAKEFYIHTDNYMTIK